MSGEPPITPGSVATVRAWLLDNRDEGVTCPCCGQLAKTYRRKITSAMAAELVKLYRLHRKNPHVVWWRSIAVRLPNKHVGDFSKLRYWGLVVEKPKDPKETRLRTSGWWRITFRGITFAKGLIEVQKYVNIYDGIPLGFEGPMVGVKEALGTKFNYVELMEGV